MAKIFKTIVFFTTAILFAVHAFALAGDNSARAWMGVKAMPKLGAVVKLRNEVIDDRTHPTIGCPWMVQDVNGQWLWIGDKRKGWVQRSQIVTIAEALAYYSQLIKDSPEQAWAYIQRAIVWLEKDEPDLGIRDLDRVIELQPQWSSARAYRACALAEKKEFAKAIADFDEAIRLRPYQASLYAGREWVQFGSRNYDQAIADFNEGIRINPGETSIYTRAALLRALFPDSHYLKNNKAVELATYACKLSGWSNAGELSLLAMVYAECGEFDLAIKYEKMAIGLNLNNKALLEQAESRLQYYKDRSKSSKWQSEILQFLHREVPPQAGLESMGIARFP